MISDSISKAGEGGPNPDEQGAAVTAQQNRAEQHAFTMLETIPDGVLNLDENCALQYVNPAAEAMLGRRSSELLGGKIWDEVPSARGGELEKQLRKVLSAGGRAEFHTKLGPWNKYYQILICECAEGAFVFLRDQTERMELTEALEEAEAWRRLIIENVKEFAIFSMDTEGRVTLWNPGAEKMFGYQPKEILGERTDAIFIPEDRAQGVPAKELAEAAEKGRAKDERWHMRKDGGRFFVSGAVVPLHGEDGRLRGFTKVARDVTDRKKLEDELQTARERLEEVVAERTAKLRETISELEVFSYSVSHDLRAPLRAMRSFSQILERNLAGKIDKRSSEFLRRIVTGAERMDRLIQDVLDYSRVTRAEVKLRTVDLEKMVEDIVNEQTALSEPRAEIQIARPLLKVRAHDASLSQCISNLVSNAVKFVAPGSRAKVRIWTERRGSCVRLWVEDEGVGIAHEYRERIFGMFERGADQSRYEGTGIGLAIVRKAVERMGGRVGVESEEGRGSKFWIELQEGAGD